MRVTECETSPSARSWRVNMREHRFGFRFRMSWTLQGGGPGELGPARLGGVEVAEQIRGSTRGSSTWGSDEKGR